MSKTNFLLLFILFIVFTLIHTYYFKNTTVHQKFSTEVEAKNVQTENNRYIENRENNRYIENIENNRQIENRENNRYIETRENNRYIETRENNIITPLKKYLENRDRSVLNDPLVAPEKRYSYTGDILENKYVVEKSIVNPVKLQYPTMMDTSESVIAVNLPVVNIRTRGMPDNFQLVGILLRDKDEKIVQLFGRPTFPGSNQFEYYIITEHNGFQNKIPIETRGQREVNDGDTINTPIGEYRIKLYNYNSPKYNPFV
jgi:hypothetical protein